MSLTEKSLKLYHNINFYKRYESLSKAYQFEERLNYSNEAVIKIIEELSYSAKYVKSDNFFKIEDKLQYIKFYFHICLKYSNVELIIGATGIKTKEFLEGGVFGRICKLISIAENQELEENIKMPKFRNYDNLRSILRESFAIYEDFKNELLKQEKAV